MVEVSYRRAVGTVLLTVSATKNLVIKKKNPNQMVEALCWHYLSSRAVTRQVLSAQTSLTSVFGMGTGGPSQQSIPTRMDGLKTIFYVKRYCV